MDTIILRFDAWIAEWVSLRLCPLAIVTRLILINIMLSTFEFMGISFSRLIATLVLEVEAFVDGTLTRLKLLKLLRLTNPNSATRWYNIMLIDFHCLILDSWDQV